MQYEHTVIKLIVVGDRARQPAERPFLTITSDEYSRCLAAMVVTMETTSAVSVGFYRSHAAEDKRAPGPVMQPNNCG